MEVLHDYDVQHRKPGKSWETVENFATEDEAKAAIDSFKRDEPGEYRYIAVPLDAEALAYREANHG